ncbi:cytoplasmic phosphatidylinositol transfer protein 1-like [Heptranchias perlo]|uniref:cytoplasmic phosphatidylinositol transfer protein 1-like n=1 Tax=Heptranchias perlo TaxID=212740 RepID=UPI00355A1375
MLIKEYRICMPLTVEEYRIGQLYMISKHSNQQSGAGEGIKVVSNTAHTDPKHGEGRYTEKCIHLNSKLPPWVRAFVPNCFYITEKAWNFYPFTVTEYTCSFLQKFSIRIETHFQNNNGSNNRVFNEVPTPAENVCPLDIVCDEFPERHYKAAEDLRTFHSVKTKRGPLTDNWKLKHNPVMCSYKLVAVKFEVYGLQTRVEEMVHKNIRDILLVGHRQAFAWIDEWFDMSLDDVRIYEKNIQEQTNKKVSIAGTEVNHQPKDLSPSKPGMLRSVSVREELLMAQSGDRASDPDLPRKANCLKQRFLSGQEQRPEFQSGMDSTSERIAVEGAPCPPSRMAKTGNTYPGVPTLCPSSLE